MKKCRHLNIQHFASAQRYTVSGGEGGEVFGFTVGMRIRRCVDCGAWLSLGKSDEHSSEQVEIDLRAAEIVAEHVNKRGRLGFTGDMVEVDGWCAHTTDVDDGKADEPAFQAGYLARAIVLHGAQR